MNTNRSLTAVTLAVLLLTNGGSRCWAEAATATNQVIRLFEQAVVAQGSDYHIARSNIVARGDGVVDFLKAKTLSTDFHARVVARGMLSWIDNPKTNALRIELLAKLVGKASSTRGGPAVSLGVFIEPGPMWEIRPAPKRVEKLEPPDPFLLEVALKGPAPLSFEQRKHVFTNVWGRDFQGEIVDQAFKEFDLWSRCLAAGLVGGHEGTDVIPVLVELLKSTNPHLRRYAAIGLKRTRNVEAIEPLLGSLSDTNEEVLTVAYYGLMELTGQDFRKGLVMPKDPVVTPKQVDDEVRKQFQAWWEENGARLLAAQKEGK